MNFAKYYNENTEYNRNLIRDKFPIRHSKWKYISSTLKAWRAGNFSLYFGISDGSTLLSLDVAIHFIMATDNKAIQLYHYILSELKTQKYDGLSSRSISNLIKQIAKPIASHFQTAKYEEEEEEDEELSGLADKINELSIPNNIKEDVLAELDDLIEYLPKDLIFKTEQNLIQIVYQIHNALKSKDLVSLIQKLNEI